MKFLLFVAIATVFDWLDMPLAMGIWLFAAGVVYENQRLNSWPNMIVED